jgi:diguanylate cyclase (GGDEF)-like protein
VSLALHPITVVVGLIALAVIAACLLWVRVVLRRKKKREALDRRRTQLGLVIEQTPPSAGKSAAVRDGAPAAAGAPSISGTFPEIVALCDRDDIDPKSILARLATLLPATLSSDPPPACRIELQGSVWWSSGYATPQHELKAPLIVNGSEVGRIILGHLVEPTERDSEARSVLEAAAVLAASMLARRADQMQLAQLAAELRDRQIMLTQMQRLARAGSWAYRRKDNAFQWSHEVRQMAGMGAEGKAPNDLEKAIAAELAPAVNDAVSTRKPLALEFSYALPNNETRWLHATGDVDIENGEVTRIIGVLRDVSEEKTALYQLAHNANHDFLTNLPNRRYLQARLEAALVERNARGGLLILDIDRFKDLNDSSGHDIGDMVLRDFSRCLYESATGAFVARLGGDEFAVLFDGTDAVNTEYQARSLIAALSVPIVVFGRSISIHVSAGLAFFPGDGRQSSELMKSADLALYEAKKRGRNIMVKYASAFREVIDRYKAVCTEVRDALPEKRFLPFYQPKISLTDGSVAGFEALLRWNHPSGLRSPGAMLPALADPSLSRALCEAMLEKILVDVAGWQGRGLPFGCVAFNASSSEFGEFDLAENLLRRLRSIGVSTSRIGVEVTESVFLNGAADSIRATLAKLHDAGVEIALDDFGTGFASLTHLQQFPVNTIKIDQSFIRGLATDAGSAGITSAVLRLGQSLGKKVVAEGVETAAQAQILKESGCDQVQGFLYARPMPASEVPGFLTSWQGLDSLAAPERAAIEQKAA